MIAGLRDQFNANFSQQRYENMVNELVQHYQHRPPFYIAETPVFIPNQLRDYLEKASHEILETINQSNFKALSEDAFYDKSLMVPNEDEKATFIAFDFGINYHPERGFFPQLIELQGFPTLNMYQYALGELYSKHFDLPDNLTTHFEGISRESYIEILKDTILRDADPKEVVLLDVEPETQNTRIDFLVTQKLLGIKELCITKVIKRGKSLFYKDENGLEIPIKRIYNRVIFDELHQRKDLSYAPIFSEEIDAEWVCHPNWFYRISKFILPLLSGGFIPPCYYLDGLEKYPEDLENYVLKPLYSFAGSGVLLGVTADDLDRIPNKHNYLLQRKVDYTPLVKTPDEPAKCEIRMIAIYNKKEGKYQLANNLVRLSKGAMIGVKFNKNKTWVGGTIGFFEG